MLTIYLRKETIDGSPVVAYYADALMRRCKAINPWPSRPTRRNRFVTLNCYRWRAVWLPDMQAEG